MTNPAAVTRFNELLDAASNGLRWQALGPLEIRKLEHEALRLRNADLAGSFEIGALVAAARGDLAGAEANYVRAQQVAGHGLDLALRHMSLLATVGAFARVREIFIEFRPSFFGRPEAVDYAVRQLLLSGWLQEAFAARIELKPQAPTTTETTEAARITGAMRAHGLLGTDISEACEFAYRFLRSRGAARHGSTTTFLDLDPGDLQCFVSYSTRGDASLVGALEWDMFEAIGAQGFAAIRSTFLSVSLSPSEAK